MKNLILILTILFSSSAFAGTSSAACDTAAYSRQLVGELAVAYLAEQLGVPVEDNVKAVDEFVVNDQYGISAYDVEVFFNDGTVEVVEFSCLEPVRLQ